ncbi:acyltransferase [Sesbania bispinosa]|nr:acyltransferase [Sesbania bispinosa]
MIVKVRGRERLPKKRAGRSEMYVGGRGGERRERARERQRGKHTTTFLVASLYIAKWWMDLLR